LAIIEENIITAFNEVGGDNNNVVTMTLNRAYRAGVRYSVKKFADPSAARETGEISGRDCRSS
jgi:hypothetical protein